jgi:cytochrome c oxidase assembly protein subunit 15
MAQAVTAVADKPSQRPVALWLLACCAMVFVMVILGGLTRLTDSGLSMVEWQLFTILPPSTEAGWQELFDKYRQSPEFLAQNSAMTVDGFKGIFWLEFIHRLWGRAIGFVFLVPFLFFLATGRVDRALAPKLAAMFVLGGLQGALGWFMVKSGLVDRPDVSQYRLAAHLFAAFVIFGFMLWVALGLLGLEESRVADRAAVARLNRRLKGLLAFLSVTIVSGAFVAGLDAGFIYNTFPLMGDSFLPPDFLVLSPVILNFFDNMATVQFDHRILAETLFVAVAWVWWSSRKTALPARARRATGAVMAMACVQVALGISTLLLLVPTHLAVTHQAGALVLFALLIWAIFETKRA